MLHFIRFRRKKYTEGPPGMRRKTHVEGPLVCKEKHILRGPLVCEGKYILRGPLVCKEKHMLRGPWYAKKNTYWGAAWYAKENTYWVKIILLIVNPSAKLLDCFEVLLYKRMNNYLLSYFEAMKWGPLLTLSSSLLPWSHRSIRWRNYITIILLLWGPLTSFRGLYVALAIVWSQHCGRVRASHKWTLANVDQKWTALITWFIAIRKFRCLVMGAFSIMRPSVTKGFTQWRNNGGDKGPMTPPPEIFSRGPEG